MLIYTSFSRPTGPRAWLLPTYPLHLFFLLAAITLQFQKGLPSIKNLPKFILRALFK